MFLFFYVAVYDAVSFNVQIAMRKKRICPIFIIKCICVQNVVVLIFSQRFVAIVYQKTEHVCTPYLNNKTTCFTEAESQNRLGVFVRVLCKNFISLLAIRRYIHMAIRSVYVGRSVLRR